MHACFSSVGYINNHSKLIDFGIISYEVTFSEETAIEKVSFVLLVSLSVTNEIHTRFEGNCRHLRIPAKLEVKL